MIISLWYKQRGKKATNWGKISTEKIVGSKKNRPVFNNIQNIDDEAMMPEPGQDRLYIGMYRHNIKGDLNISVPLTDRFRHVFVCGATGVGKSSLLVNMINQDMHNGYGLCFIDPKGDAVEEILMRVPEHRIDDVILIDPANYDKVVGLNFLELPKKHMDESQINAVKEVVVADLVALMRQQTQIWGERFGRIFETLVRAILDFNERVSEEDQLTFIDLYVLLTDDDVRNKFAETVDDPIIREYLLKINEMSGDVMEPVIRRLNDWVMNKIARQIIAHRKSSFDFREAIDTNKIILVRIPKGEVGETIMQLVGTTVLSKIWAAAKSRINQKPEDRVPFFLYIDEFSNFAFEGSTFDEILSEARAFKLGLTIATQYPSQLSPKIRESVYSNSGTVISFNLQNPSDASVLVKRFPGVKVEDLLSLGLYRAMVRIMVRNEMSDPFVIRTFQPTPSVRALDGIREVAERCLSIYGRERMSNVELSASLRRIKELCELQPKSGLMNELISVLYALVLKEKEVNYLTFSREAKSRGINVDERKYDRFIDIADKSGYISLKTDFSTGKLIVTPDKEKISEFFWADKSGKITVGFTDHRRMIMRAYEFFTSLGFIVEVPKGPLPEFGDYIPDLVLRLPGDVEERGRCYSYFGRDRIVVEVESTTQRKPGMILKKLSRAYRAGYFLIYIVKGYGDNLREYVYPATQIHNVIENMRGARGLYKTNELERDKKGRPIWENKATGDVAYLEGNRLYTFGGKLICTVNEARDRGWVPKKVLFDPSEEFKNMPMPKYGESCTILMLPAEGMDFPVVQFAKGAAHYYLISVPGRKEVSEVIRRALMKGEYTSVVEELKELVGESTSPP